MDTRPHLRLFGMDLEPGVTYPVRCADVTYREHAPTSPPVQLLRTRRRISNHGSIHTLQAFDTRLPAVVFYEGLEGLTSAADAPMLLSLSVYWSGEYLVFYADILLFCEDLFATRPLNRWDLTLTKPGADIDIACDTDTPEDEFVFKELT
jgi:hypothetical protein